MEARQRDVCGAVIEIDVYFSTLLSFVLSRETGKEMARLSLGVVDAPRGMPQRRRRRRPTMRPLAALLLLLLLMLTLACSFAAPLDPDDDDDDDANADARALFERSYFQLPAHLRQAARADLGGVEFDRGLYIGEEKNERGEKKTKKTKEKEVDAASSSSSSAAEEKTTATSTSTSSSASAAAATAAAVAAAAAAPFRQAVPPGENVKVMIVQPDAQQMEAIMRGEQVK